MKNPIIIYAVVLTALASMAYADGGVTLYMFHGQGCPHCAAANQWLDGIQEEYPNLTILRYEVYNDESNQELFQQYSRLSGQPIRGVPTFFLDQEMIPGFSNAIGQELEAFIQECLESGCSDFEGAPEISVNDTYYLQESYEYEENIGLIFIGIVAVLALLFVIRKVVK